MTISLQGTARAEETWLVAPGCNERLNQPEFKTSVRSLFGGVSVGFAASDPGETANDALGGRESAAS
jgi:hypothetical protein